MKAERQDVGRFQGVLANPPEGVEIDKKLVTKADEEYWRNYRAAPKLSATTTRPAAAVMPP